MDLEDNDRLLDSALERKLIFHLFTSTGFVIFHIFPKNHQKFIFCEYECNIRKKAAIESGLGGFDFFIILLRNLAYFQARKLQKMLKTAKIEFFVQSA